MVIDRQNKVHVDVRALRHFTGRLRRGLRLGRADFNICLVSDAEIARLNATYRRKSRPTDVLSFPWDEGGDGVRPLSIGHSKSSLVERRGKKKATPNTNPEAAVFENFLGDVVISTETARRNARAEGQSVAREIRWLILHGVLHLLGYDHETDSGEMMALELSLRERLRI